MPITFRHDAAGIPLGKGDDARSKYGMAMVGQQQKYDAEMRQGQQDAMYGMQKLGAMRDMQSAREPSLGEESAMMDNEIRSGAYDPDTVRALRDNERAIKLILRDRSLNATQQSMAIGNIRSQMRMMRSTGRVQPMMQQMGPAALQTKPPMTEAEYFSDENNYAKAYAAAQARLEAAGPDTPATPENIQAQMHNDYLARQKFVEGLRQPQGQGQPAAQPPAAQPQGVTQSVGSADIGGGNVFGVNPVLASPIPGGGTGVRAAPNGSIYGDQGQFLGNTDLYDQAGASYIRQQASAQPQQVSPPQQAPAIYPTQAIAGMQSQGQSAPSQSGGAVRRWTSADGKFSTDGEIVGVSNQAGGEPTVSIRKTDGNVVNVPMSKLSEQDRSFSYTGGNRDTAFDLQNRGRTAGTNFMDPENPVYKEMMTPQQNQAPDEGKFMGRYGLGGVDYGINPATGNRVTASVRPGGTMVEYDEPVGTPGTAMRGRRGSVSYTGGRKPVASQKSPGEATPAEQARYEALPASPSSSASVTAAAPPRINKDDPKINEALAIARNPDSVTADQQKKAAIILRDAGYTAEQIKAEIDSQGTSKPRQESGAKAPSGQPSYGMLQDAYKTVRVAQGGVGKDRRTSKQVDDAKALLKTSGWTDNEIQDLYLGRSTKKLGPPRATQEEIQGMLQHLQSGNPSDAERSVIEDILKSEGVDFAKNPASPSQKEARPATSPENPVAQSSPAQQSQSSRAATAPPSKMRTWTSVEGKTFDGVIVEGSLSSSASDPEGQQMIKVQRKDGEIFNIPVSRLSDEDKAYLDALYKLGNTSAWLDRNGIGVSAGEAYKYENLSSPQDSKPTSKQKYKTRGSEKPKEMRMKPNSSSMSSVKRTS
jgi:hypothetical protein